MHAGQPEATRIAVDLPQDFCGAASLGLRYPDSIQAADNGAGARTCLHSNSLPLIIYRQALRDGCVGDPASRHAQMPCSSLADNGGLREGQSALQGCITVGVCMHHPIPLHAVAGVCADGGSSAVTWTKVCGGAANALVPTSAVEVIDPATVGSQCAATY